MTTELVFRDDVVVKLRDSMGGDESVIEAMLVSSDKDGLIEEMLSIPKTRGRIRFLMRKKHGCFDSETEVLTSVGWKPWPSVDGTEEFVTWNLQSDEIQLQQATHVVHKTISDKMVRIKMAQVDALVTLDHRMVAAPHTRQGWDVGLYPARDFLVRSHRIPLCGGTWNGDLHVPDTAELVGFIAADGNVRSGVKFRLRRERKINWLKARVSLSQSEDKFRLIGVSTDLMRWAKMTYTSSGDRCLPRELLERGDQETLQALLDGFLVGDGHVSPTGRVTCSTVSRQMVDDLQELALKVGSCAVETEPDYQRHGAFGVRPLYRLTVYRDRNAFPRVGWTEEARQEQVQIVDYEGEVHCVTVPNGTLYVRRNGKPMWCGNTPFEHNALKFYVECPIFVLREWHRHRIGWCLAGDTEVTLETITERCGRTLRKRSIADLYQKWHHGFVDAAGRHRRLATSRNFTVRCLNEDTQVFELARVLDVYESGVKRLMRFTTEDGRQLRCSEDHAIYTDDGWVKAGDLAEHQRVAVSGKRSLFDGRQYPPSLRAGIGVWTSMQRTSRIRPLDICYQCGEFFGREDLVLDHVIPVVADLTRALDVTNLAPMCKPCHRIKTDAEQRLALRGQTAGSKFVRFKHDRGPEHEEMTYDLAVEGPWHNFVANGIVVHNSYNEQSGRYSELPPMFYIPPPERPLLQVGKPGAYEYVPGTEDQYWLTVQSIKGINILCYEKYQSLLARGIAREVARMVLPVNIYSKMYATCNARSLMAYLSLRTNEPEATFPSTPMYEIEACARAAEQALATLFPYTYEAYCEFGRVAP